VRYQVRHVTHYAYAAPVVHAHHVAHLRPRSLPGQRVEHAYVTSTPGPMLLTHGVDYFGNATDYFELRGSHDSLEVIATSNVETQPQPLATSLPRLSPSWGDVESALSNDPELIPMQEYRLASPLVRPSSALRDYALTSFTPGRPLIEATIALNQAIWKDFKYEPLATDVSTPLTRVITEKRGVCQDFAHVAVGCLRSLGLAARYVSGYLETTSSPDRPQLTGANASHAWASVYIPEIGWLDFDPTNNVLPSDRHVTVAWGRDFSDVSPLKGVMLGGGSHVVRVGVEVQPI
jgi:transglutaminase-like putative cysteine protease